MTYTIDIAGLTRELPLCKVTDDTYIAAFICFGDAELTEAYAREMLKLVPREDYDYILTAEAKGIPLGHEMARQSGMKKHFVARKSAKTYMPDPISVDDVISTGGSLRAMEALVQIAGGTVSGRVAAIAEGDACKRDDVKFIDHLPLFDADGNPK